MNQLRRRIGPRLAAFSALCADHHTDVSQAVRAVLIVSAIVLAVLAALLQALIQHPLPPITADLISNAAFTGFEPMAAPPSMTGQPPVDAGAIVSGMFLAVAIITAAFAGLAFLIDCVTQAVAIAHRLSMARKLPEAEGGD
ncbi:MAG TPA: hypothetical protein VGV37_10415 [Aliidongia sp.]|uniref:hypothetical protein n=1 Tax=Aliidongia sp. TaxID=1914230 RepID=UPI002DDD4DFF|nr:hypothetical protein [Aliidongia sp.]HEV2674944.1 hypothetical protein [Aliidongia sp.]